MMCVGYRRSHRCFHIKSGENSRPGGMVVAVEPESRNVEPESMNFALLSENVIERECRFEWI